MIKPTVGRVVWVIRPRNTNDIEQPEVGLITYVWGDGLINVAGFDHNGAQFAITSLPLLQDDEPKPPGNFACWMPYQKAVASGQQPPTLHSS